MNEAFKQARRVAGTAAQGIMYNVVPAAVRSGVAVCNQDGGHGYSKRDRTGRQRQPIEAMPESRIRCPCPTPGFHYFVNSAAEQRAATQRKEAAVGITWAQAQAGGSFMTMTAVTPPMCCPYAAEQPWWAPQPDPQGKCLCLHCVLWWPLQKNTGIHFISTEEMRP